MTISLKGALKYLFIHLWLHGVLVAVHGFSLVAVSEGYSLLRRVGLSLQRLLLLQSTDSGALRL